MSPLSPPTTRRLLGSLMALGMVVTLVGGTGIFAVFTDQATTGTNTVLAGERPSAADIQIATASVVDGAVACDPFSNNLESGIFAVSDMPAGGGESAWMCVNNAGAADVSVAVSAIDLLDSDPQCTGDESSVDATCGQAGGFGQLSAALRVYLKSGNCTNAIVDDTLVGTGLPDLASTTPLTHSALSPLPAGEIVCIKLIVAYPDPSELVAQAAQSDEVAWRFAFDAATEE